MAVPVRPASARSPPMSGFGRSWRVAVAVALPLMQPGAPDALLARSSLTPDVRDSAITLVDNTHEAVTEGLDGVRQGEDAASAEQVPAAEYSDTSPPPPGSTWAPSSQPLGGSKNRRRRSRRWTSRARQHPVHQRLLNRRWTSLARQRPVHQRLLNRKRTSRARQRPLSRSPPRTRPWSRSRSQSRESPDSGGAAGSPPGPSATGPDRIESTGE